MKGMVGAEVALREPWLHAIITYPITQVGNLKVHPRFCPFPSCPICNRSSCLGELTFFISPESFLSLVSFITTPLLQVLPSHLTAKAYYDCLLPVMSLPIHSRLSVTDLLARRLPFSRKQSWISPFIHLL